MKGSEILEKILERSPAIASAVRREELMLKGAVYSLSTGEVTILEEEGEGYGRS